MLTDLAPAPGSLPSQSVPGVLWILLAALAVALAVALGAALAQWSRGHRTRHRVKSALVQESLAEDLLLQDGFQIIAAQAVVNWPVMTDETEVMIALRVDYLVERDGLRYVADAKFGDHVTSIRHGQTRRQLLEYLLAYDAEGALLVNMTRGEIVEVQFPALDLALRTPARVAP